MNYLLLPILIALLCLPACLPLANQAPVSSESSKEQAMALFIEGLDQFDPSRRSASFAQLEQQYPDSPWNRRAKSVANLGATLRLLEKQLKRQQVMIDNQQNDHQALATLRPQNLLLQEQVDVLKALIVDLELRQP